ncbi:hypothetical protein J0S82_015008 [Galemys pyrenaicus]|uniref:Uncharacterized protein n=1 Tax=Galemys pyrenaicus TaxID=202257 RepID=A0A8J6ACX9_GALPY|nr:hypothetical protein J0S82_015008 [Galemys pyrenaicus]
MLMSILRLNQLLSFSGRPQRGSETRVCAPTPTLPLAPSARACQTPPAPARPGPTRRAAAPTPSAPETSAGTERGTAGAGPAGSGLVSGTRGGGRLAGVPPPPGQSVPWPPPQTHRQKDRQPATKGGARSPSILSPAAEGRNPGSFYPAPRRSAALRVPGPRLRTDGPPDNGPWAAARAGRAGAIRDWAPAGGGRLRAEPVTGSRGAALQTDKANGRQTDGGGKDGDAGGGSAQLAHPQREGRVHELLLSPSPRSPA